MTISRLRVTMATWATAASCVVGLAIGAAVARADAFGELAKIGKFGEGASEFDFAVGLAVDPTNNNVFVVDEQKRKSRAASKHYRIQEFPEGLASQTASVPVEIPTVETKKGEFEFRFIAGVAVDPSLHRLYLLVGINTEDSQASSVAQEVRVYSTEASGGTLKLEEAVLSAAGTPGVAYEFPSFPEGSSPTVPSNTVLYPEQLAVDPQSHELLVLGQDASHDALIQRIAVGGSSPASFYEDTSHRLSHESRVGLPTGLSVGPDRSVYVTVKSTPTNPQERGVVKVASDFSTFTPVRQESSGSPLLTGGFESGTGSKNYGSQVAASPDQSGPYAGLVYAFEESRAQAFGSPPTAGIYEIRGMSATSGAQQIVYGGEEWQSAATQCTISSSAQAVAAGSNGIVYALDEGAEYGAELQSSFGFDLVEFGPGGQHCPAPTTSFKINGDTSTATVKAQKGEEVKFEAASEGLHGETPAELVWEGEGPEKYKTEVKEAGGQPAALTTTHKFLKPGLYTITLNMKVSPGTLGSPPPVTRQVEVTAPPPIAKFEASSESPKPGETVTFNAEKSIDPAGSAQGGPTNHLKSYTWEFGDGSAPQTTSSPTTTHVFANAGTEPKQDTVTLTVTNEEEVMSAPTSQALTIQGTPQAKEEKPVEKPVVKVEEKPLVAPPVDRNPTELSPRAVAGSGLVKLSLACPATKASCGGSVLLSATERAKKRGRKASHVTLGQASFSLAGGQQGTVTVRLSASGLALLRREKTLKAQIVVRAHDSFGDPKVDTLTMTLHAPRTKKH